MSKFGSKLTYLDILDSIFQKTIVIYEINNLTFLKNEFFNSSSKFWYRSAFSEGLGQGPDPLYKVCIFLEQLQSFF